MSGLGISNLLRFGSQDIGLSPDFEKTNLIGKQKKQREPDAAADPGGDAKEKSSQNNMQGRTGLG